MGGTVAGGRKATQTNKKRYGTDFYIKMGQKGGKIGRTGGFYADRELASRAGKIGGRVSKRGKSYKQAVVPEDVEPHKRKFFIWR